MSLMSELEDLGELMADNLVTMGVTDAQASDGLTTLANKILDISPTPVTQTLTLTSDKSILSYKDSETATLTATLTGGTVSGQTIEFFNGATSIGTATTDSNGVATKTYSATGVGNVVFSATKGSVASQPITVEDYQYYTDNMQKIKSNFIADTTTASGRTIYVSPFTFNSDVEIEFKLKNIPNNWVLGFGSNGTVVNSKAVWFKLQNYNQSKLSIMYIDTGGTARDVGITTSYDTSTVFTIKSENIHKIYWYLNSTIQAYRDTRTTVPLGLRVDIFDNQDYDVDYIKVKAL